MKDKDKTPKNEIEELRITNVSPNLRKDLIIIAERKGYPTLTAFLKPELRKLANECLLELKIKPSHEL